MVAETKQDPRILAEALLTRGYELEGMEQFRKDAPKEPVRTTFMQRLQDSVKSVPERFRQGFGTDQEREMRVETSKGFDLADLPGDLADVAGRALPTGGMLLGGAVGGILGAGAGVIGAIPGAIAGAGAGAGIGEAGTQAAGRLMGMRKGETVGQELLGIGTEAVSGAVAEATGALGGKVLGAVAKSKPAQAGVKWLSEKIPFRITNSILKPISKEFDFGKNPGQAVVDERIVAPTRGILRDKIIAKKKEIGGALADVIERASVGDDVAQIDLEPLIMQPIREAMLGAKKRGESVYYNALVDLMEGLTSDFEEKGGRLVVKSVLGQEMKKPLVVSPFGAWMEKQNLGDGIRWTGQAFDNDLNQVKFRIFSNVKGALTKAVPQSKELFRRYANLLGAEKSIERTVSIMERQNLASFGQTTLGGLTAIGSLATGDSTPEALVKGAGAALLLRGAGSPVVKTVTAQALRNLPKAASSIMKSIERLEPAAKAALFNYLSESLGTNPAMPESTEESP
jgi:hypothetical protein